MPGVLAKTLRTFSRIEGFLIETEVLAVTPDAPPCSPACSEYEKASIGRPVCRDGTACTSPAEPGEFKDPKDVVIWPFEAWEEDCEILAESGDCVIGGVGAPRFALISGSETGCFKTVVGFIHTSSKRWAHRFSELLFARGGLENKALQYRHLSNSDAFGFGFDGVISLFWQPTHRARLGTLAQRDRAPHGGIWPGLAAKPTASEQGRPPSCSLKPAASPAR